MKKPVYNSLGSNYSWQFAWLALKSVLTNSSSNVQRLGTRLSQDWGGEVILTGRGRQAITALLTKWRFGKGDVVLTQAFSCQAVEWGIAQSGAKPIFLDTMPSRSNFGVEELSNAWFKHDLDQIIGQQHKVAVLVQHCLGNTAPIAEIADWCREHKAVLIEDLAQGLTISKLQPGELGSYGDGLIFSFGQDKMIDAVMGGAAIDKLSDKNQLVVAAKRIESSVGGDQPKSLGRHCGHACPANGGDSQSQNTSFTNSSDRCRSALYPMTTQLIHSTRPLILSKLIFRIARWLKIIRSPVLQTSNEIESLPASIVPLIEYQFEQLESSVIHRRRIAKIYQNFLSQWAISVDIDASSCLRFNLLVPNPNGLIDFLRSNNIFIADRWYRRPLDSGRLKYPTSYKSGECPNSEVFCRNVVNLPTHQRVSPEIAQHICELIISYLESSSTNQTSTNLVWEKCANQEDWETFLAKFPEANFLQSWQWGDFQEQLGKTVIRSVLIQTKGEISQSSIESTPSGVVMLDRAHRILKQALVDEVGVVAMFQAVVEPAKRGRYLTIAGGPLLDWSQPKLFKYVLQQVRFIAHQHHCHFVRFRPQEIDSPALRSILSKNETRPAPMHLTADLTLQLDLTLSEEELLKAMRKQTRQAIRKAEQLGITTRISQDPAEIDQMYQDQLVLAKKHGFVPFTNEFWQKQFQAFVASNKAWLVQADDAKGNRLATAFIIAYHGEAVYHYGTSTAANEKLPGSYSCQWRAIREAKIRGCRLYNMWGIAPIDQPHHRFAGVSTFKRGFGGQEVAYLLAHDIPIDSRYWFTFAVEIVRRRFRNL